MNSTIGIIVAIVVAVSWVIKGLSAATGNEEEGGRKRPNRSIEDWDDLQAKRREAMSEQQQALSEMRAESSAPDPSQMTMAERIELARQRARQQAGLPAQDAPDASAQRRERELAERRAQEQREAELRARRRRAEQERAAQEQRAQADRAKQQRRRQAEQQAEREAQAQRQRRAKQQRRSQSSGTKRATTGSKRESVVAESIQRIHQGQEHGDQKTSRRSKPGAMPASAVKLGLVDRNALRKAFIMKELLDKPVALRDPQADLPS